MTRSRVELRRELGPRALAVYGIGGMLGGGIYALVGEVAGLAGSWSWLSFLLAMVVAAPTALVYAELAARHPRSGGESLFAKVAFGGETAPLLVGWMVLLSGIVSMAALARAFAGYVQDVLPGVPTSGLVVAFLAGLGLVNLRGIRLASAANILCTIVEVSGLVLVVVAGAAFFAGDQPAPPPVTPGTAPVGALAVVHGAALAFYAFIGFEDMVNVAEEVRQPRRAYPVAIPLALVFVGVLYAVVVFVATAAVPPADLASSAAPLTLVVERGADRVPSEAFALVALFAVANTALLNFVTASRLAYGMSNEGLLPGWVGSLHRSRRTPHRAIAAIFVLALSLALSGGVGFLAGATSFLLLTVFFTMNLALVHIRREGDDTTQGFRCPAYVPWTGMALSAGLAFFVPSKAILAALAIVAGGVLVAVAMRGLRRRAT